MKFKLICILFLAVSVGTFAQKSKKPASEKKPATELTDGIFATLETTKGRIVVRLELEKTPITVANFISLAEGTNKSVDEKYKGKPFYNGLKFHRVIKNFMIQGGDPLGNGSGNPGYKFKDEITDLKHDSAGILSMANSGPATNGSQFFITHKETSWLDGIHTVFGKVESGMDVVNAIVQDDVIMEVKITRKGKEAKKFDAAKVFATYFDNKEAEAKKLAALEAEKQKGLEKVKSDKKENLARLKANAVKTASGLEYVITEKGTGAKPTEGTVYVHYAGYLEDGSLFESSYEEVSKTYGKFDHRRAAQNGYMPFPFQIENNRGLVPGFLEGLKMLSFGDKATLFIPSNLAYGPQGNGHVIPPNANLIFEIEMLEKMPSKE